MSTETLPSKNDATLLSKNQTCSFIVTGFGKFRGVPNNPTTTLIGRLRNESTSDLLSSRGIHILETHIFETSAAAVEEEVNGIYTRLNDMFLTNSENKPPPPVGEGRAVVVIHLGVNYKGTRFQLEQCAYNDATFRVPDERGYKPNGVCIIENDPNNEGGPNTTAENTISTKSKEFGKCLNTNLDLEQICSELQKNESAAVCVSTDPGRFVCNYTYFFSLDKISKCMDKIRHLYNAGGERDNDSGNVDKDIPLPPSIRPAYVNTSLHALFVHVPPFHVVAEEEQLIFVLDIMSEIQKQVVADMC